MGNFVEVVVTATGRKQRVPEHWLDHPLLSKPFRQTPSQRAAAEAEQLREQGPQESWTIAQFRAYAEPLGIDLTGLRLHDEIAATVIAAVAPKNPETGTPDTADADNTTQE